MSSNKNINKIALNSMFVTVGMIIVGIISFLLIPFIISKIGLQQYGVFLIFVLFSYKGILSIFSFGLQDLTIKLVARKDELKEVVSTMVFLNIIISIFLISILFIISDLLSNNFKIYAELEVYFKLLFLSFICQFLIVIFKAVLSGYQEFKYLKALEILVSALNAILVVVFLNFFPSLETIVLIFIGVVFLEFSILLYYIYSSKKLISFGSIDFSLLKKNSHVWKNYFLMKVSSTLASQGDRLLVMSVLTPSSLALYEIVAKLPFFLKNIFSIVNQVVLPEASRISKFDDKSKQIMLYQRGVNFLFFISFPVIIFFQFNATDFLYYWLGQEYVHLSMLLQVFLIWNIANLIVTFGWSIMYGAGENLSLLTRISYATFALKIFLLVLFVYMYDLLGIVIATVLSLSIASAYLLYVYAKYYMLSLVKSLIDYTKLLSIIVFVLYVMNDLFSDHHNFLLFTLQSTFSLGIVWVTLYYSFLSNENKVYLMYLWRKLISFF